MRFFASGVPGVAGLEAASRNVAYSANRVTDKSEVIHFDEKKFRGYGPYGYDVKELIAREQTARARQRRKPA